MTRRLRKIKKHVYQQGYNYISTIIFTMGVHRVENEHLPPWKFGLRIKTF